MNYIIISPLTETVLLHNALSATSIDIQAIGATIPKGVGSTLP